MKILYCNVIKKNYGWGAEWSLNKAFNSLFIETFCIDYRENRKHLFSRFFDFQQDFDYFFLQRGDYFPRKIVESINRPSFFWCSELLSRRNDTDHLLSNKLFSHIFFRTDNCIEIALAKGDLDKKNCSILLSAFDDQIHIPYPEFKNKKEYDIVFIGSMNKRRQNIVEEIGKFYSIRTFNSFGKEMSIIFNKAKIVLNIHADNYLDTETRVFECLGSGSFLLTEKLSGENPFNQNHLVEYYSINDLLEKINYYLNNDEERLIISQSGYHEAITKHTYLNRAEEISKLFLNAKPTLINNSIDKNKLILPQNLERFNIYNNFFKFIK